MRRLAHLADLHIGVRGPEETSRVLDELVQDITRWGPDLIVVPGDIYEGDSTPWQRLLAHEFFASLLTAAPVVVVKGNHDRPHDLAPLAYIGVKVAESYTIIPNLHRSGFGVICVPWIDKAFIAASTDTDAAGKERTDAAAGTVIRTFLESQRAVSDQIRSDGVIPILAGHLMVGGSRMSSGQILIGKTVEVAPDTLVATGAEYIALGHIHAHQTFGLSERVVYSGSPDRHNFGEMEDKGWVAVTFSDDGRLDEVRFQPLQGVRPMIHLDVDLDQVLAWQRLEALPPCVDDAYVRIRFQIDAADLTALDGNAVASAFKAHGAHHVKIEPLITHSRTTREASATAMSIAMSLWSKVGAWMETRGYPLDETIQAKLARLEGGEQ